jgi:hypothetical protein
VREYKRRAEGILSSVTNVSYYYMAIQPHPFFLQDIVVVVDMNDIVLESRVLWLYSISRTHGNHSIIIIKPNLIRAMIIRIEPYTYNFNRVLDWLITRTKLCDLLIIIIVYE